MITLAATLLATSLGAHPGAAAQAEPAPRTATGAPAGSPYAGPVADSLIVRRVNEYLDRLAERGYNGGVLVVRDGRVVLEKSWGFADRAAGIRADARTVYNIGSITKQFTAAAILRLEELGKLHTTDSIVRFFPAAPADKRGITIHQLLTHTAGFASDYAPSDYEPNTRAEYIGRMFAAPLRSTPGTEFSYANSGYSMLAAIIELVTGKEYEQALTDLVLVPAGMTETGYTAPHWAKERIAHGYEDGRDWGTIVERITGPGRPYWALRGNGGLGTTLGDFAKWDAALRSNRVLTDSSLRKFMTGYINEGPQGRSKYAYGWAVITTWRGTRLVTHNGGNGVYVAEWLRYVDEGVAIFVTSTNADIRATPVSEVVSRIVFGEPYDLPPRAVAADAAALAAMAGTWRLPSGGRVTFTVTPRGLVADAAGQDAWALVHNGDTASAPMAAALNAKARVIADAAVRGDVKPLVAELDGGPPPEEVERQEAQLMAGRRERWGDLKSVDVLGTARDPAGFLMTTVRLMFERGAATNLYGWNRDGQIVDVRARPYQPIALTPLEGGEFAVTQATGAPLVRFRREGEGIAAVLSTGTRVLLLP